MAARLSAADPKKSVCILERGREWPIGKFPDSAARVTAEFRNPLTKPLGLYEFLTFSDISIIQGSGLGGTSLVNANVAIVPDEEVFQQSAWPGNITLAELTPYYEKARKVLAANPHPRARELLKVKALKRRAQEIGERNFPLDVVVNFDIEGKNPYGVEQKPCIDCGDCVTGCNVGAKNTLYMNYLPLAKRNGTDIFTQTRVDWLEKVPGGGWRIHGRRYSRFSWPRSFTLDAGRVILSAGALGTTEILLRSETHNLSLSPRVGSSFTGNGDFFGTAYNSDYQTNVLGFGNSPDNAWRKNAPGPTIVGAIQYERGLPLEKQFLVEDLSFPKACIGPLMLAFGAIGGQDTDVGDELDEFSRRLRDNPFQPYNEHNAMNHTMMYLVMGHDDAKGIIRLNTSFFDPNGRIEVDWDHVGRQTLFRRINDELRRHTRSLGGSFIENPFWSFMSARNVVTAHPLGGCPMGEDYMHGAVDEFGRVFASDGSIHEGLFVADGSLISTSLGVNPFMTICALSERIAERLARNIKGEPYPAQPTKVSVSRVDPLEVINYKEAELERLFSRVETRSIEIIVNTGQRDVDVSKGIIRNDTVWKGFFPRRHVLNQISTAFSTGFKKRFWRTPDGILGITSDADGRINAKNTLEEVTISKRIGNLDPGKYILLRYPDPPWNIYYDIFKVINEDLLIGRVYVGRFPKGVRLFTFPMVRTYGLDNLTVSDHNSLYEAGKVPSKDQLNGLWEMRAISNGANTGVVAYLKFDLKPDGRLEVRYRFLGLLEGLVEPVFAPDHFQLNDFTAFHDEIRLVSEGFMVGKYTTASPPGLMELFGPGSLGLFHQETSVGGTPQFSLYYSLKRSEADEMPPNVFLEPLLDVQLPDGLGMSFEEEMVGYYYPGLSVPQVREGDLQLESRFHEPGPGDVECGFRVKITMDDLNEFLDNPDHEAHLDGTIHFGDFAGQGEKTFQIDPQKSRFNYLRVNPDTQEAEMIYRIYFCDSQDRECVFFGRKYLQKDRGSGIGGVQEVVHDYTTLYCHLTEVSSGKELGSGLLKFRTFESLESVSSFAKFLNSFQVTGTDNPFLKAQGKLRFMAFTNQFIMREYDPLLAEGSFMADEIREAVLRGAETPDYFSTRPTDELQRILRETPTLPLETLLNHGGVEIDYQNRRIWRDSFWKGSFAKDTLLGWEERIRNTGFDALAEKTLGSYTGGSFWKRFDRIEDDQAIGHVVNYELHFLPGKPVVRRVKYPDNNRKYFKAGDDVLLLNYTNEPYRIVYDVIKAIDKNNCIGVMHLGKFPTGIEFATFVMARHNYPFAKMSVPDHRVIFESAHTRVPSPDQVAGEWKGYLIFLTRPDISLLNQLNRVLFHVKFVPVTDGIEARFRFGILPWKAKDVEFTDEFARLSNFGTFDSEVRMIDDKTLIGKWISPAGVPWLKSTLVQEALKGYLEPGRDRLAFYYILERE